MSSESGSSLSPLMQQFHDIKQEHADTLLLFQVGDFYELFFDDAKQAAAFLGITLTKRGTPFQISAWKQLQAISYGTTLSYKELAVRVGNPSAFRAVANANGANTMVIVIPCHRVINSNGALGGYSAGIERKKWLLAHEKAMRARNVI